MIIKWSTRTILYIYISHIVPVINFSYISTIYFGIFIYVKKTNMEMIRNEKKQETFDVCTCK